MASSSPQPHAHDAMAFQQVTDEPEVVPDTSPEVVPQQYLQQQYSQQQMGLSPQSMDMLMVKPPENTLSMYTPSYIADPSVVDQSVAHNTSSPQQLYSPTPGLDQSVAGTYLIDEKPGKRRIFGCTLTVFILSVAVGILAAAVIGLAAGMGVEVDRAHKAEEKADRLSTSLAALGANPTSTAVPDNNYDAVTNNCSTHAATVSGTTYTPEVPKNGPTFTIYCNKDATHPPILALFAYDFNSCMDACVAYSKYVGGNVGTLNITSNVNTLNTTSNATSTSSETNEKPIWAKCKGVSFVPAWWDRSKAKKNNAPGNCYLKYGPQNQSTLDGPGSKEVHAGIIEE